MKYDARLDRLTLNFAIFAIIAAALLGLGQRSFFLPFLITVGVTLSYVLTDRLQILVLPRLAAYVSMLAGAVIAIGQMFASGKIDHLPAVANLLVYVQLGLMFQQKDRRVFEQWGIFLLLEMIVAALVNDNLLYGVLLIPVMWVGCSTLLCYASYVSNSKSGTSGIESESILFRALKWLGRDRELKKTENSIQMALAKTPNAIENLGGTRIGLRRAVGFSANILIFAIAFFYIMPRLKSDAYEGAGWSQPVVGFSGEVSLEHVGKLLETNATALKVKFLAASDGKEMRPLEPPYIRGAICHVYIGAGRWENLDKDTIAEGFLESTPSSRDIVESLEKNTDGYEMIVEEQTFFENATFSIPPLAKSTGRDTPSEILASDWTLFDRHHSKSSNDKRRYRFRSYAYENGVQARLLPLFSDCLEDVNVSTRASQNSTARHQLFSSFDAEHFPGVIALRDKILAKEEKKGVASQVLALEDYLVTSPEFTYSLEPSLMRNPQVDPIEDFASNHRTGHCQYYASTMAMMLRSMGVPSRIVLGFRPSDFNMTGMYFVVRQKHAHSWVEAFLTKDQLLEAGIRVPAYIGAGAWLRLDPTPPGEGSNAGGSLRSRMGQLETLQQLWKDYVMGVDSSDQPEMLQMFNAADQGLYAQLRLNAEKLFYSLQTNQLVGGVFNPTQWFSVGGALGLIALLLIAVAAYKAARYFYSKSRGLKWKRSTIDAQRFVQIKFYRRVIHALNRLQLRRSPNQTPLEFAKEVEDFFVARKDQFGNLQLEIQFLTSIYYRLRFGFDASIPESDWQKIEAATQRIEQIAANRKTYMRAAST